MANGYIHVSEETTFFDGYSYIQKSPVCDLKKPILLDFPNGIKAIDDNENIVTIPGNYCILSMFINYLTSDTPLLDMMGLEFVKDTNNNSYTSLSVSCGFDNDNNTLAIAFHVRT